MFYIKEQGKTLGEKKKKLSDMVISNLPDKGFKVMIIMIFTKLRLMQKERKCQDQSLSILWVLYLLNISDGVPHHHSTSEPCCFLLSEWTQRASPGCQRRPRGASSGAAGKRVCCGLCHQGNVCAGHIYLMVKRKQFKPSFPWLYISEVCRNTKILHNAELKLKPLFIKSCRV